MENALDLNLAGATLRGGTPYKSYKKTSLGKVYITIWNSFEKRPEGILLQGDPKAGDESTIIDMWSVDEDYFFRNKNKMHLDTGEVVEYARKSVQVEKTVEQFTDEELETLLDEKFKKFFSFTNMLNNTKSLALLFRIRGFAEDKEKSEKVMNAIDARISELQLEELGPAPSSVITEL